MHQSFKFLVLSSFFVVEICRLLGIVVLKSTHVIVGLLSNCEFE